ncbi:MAG: threonine--tRNA ligase [Terriglobales bacterium]
MIQALELLRRHSDTRLRLFPIGEDVPLDGIVSGLWRKAVFETDNQGRQRVNRITYEICVLQALRERLRCKEIWVVGANRCRNPDDDLAADFEARRAPYYEALSLPLDADIFIEELWTEMPWLGDEKNPQLQRIYGTSFFSKKDLDAYLNSIEEAKKRDHRVLGKQLDLFSIQELAGPGLIFWHPKGGIIRKEMEDWMREEYLRRGYSLVCTPHVSRRQLFHTSGHEGYYSQNMFDAMELDDAEYRLKPMNCPGHILIYKDSLKSYRDLPVRLGELGTVYRYERSGVMHGLLRVRGFTQDDAHIFCTPDQIEAEIVGCLEFALEVLKDFGFDKFQTELSTWDPKDKKSFLGTEDQWNLATHSLESALKKLNIEYKTIPGEAAFYGPKIDVKLVDAIGRLWQLSTVQFDFNLPQRFQLEYVAEDGTRKQPLMVHRALYGSVERFFGVLIEHYAGAFPVWLSPVQVAMIPIAERHTEYAEKVASQLRAAGVRVEVDARNEKMNAKIREHAMQKVPFLLVVGDKEAEANKVNVRTRGKEKTEDMATAEFVEKIKKLIADKSPTL